MQRPSREAMLAKIRDALSASAAPGHEGAVAAGESPRRVSQEEQVAQIKSSCADQREYLIRRFESELTKVGGRFAIAESREAARNLILRLATEHQSRSVVGWNVEVIDRLAIGQALSESGISFIADDGGGDFVERARHAELGISGVDFALADTGTLVLLTGKGRARSASLLPPVHIAVITPEQMIRGLDDLFPMLRLTTQKEELPVSSAVTFITGPSRTGDIEMILVVGVHGPQQLQVILLNDSMNP